MKLYALLIGINNYKGNPLRQCVDDAKKVEKYLKTQATGFEEVNFKILHNQDATRENVISGITDFLSQATDEDVALLYYSGHGALEESGGIFPDEQDGLLESMVCYSDREISTDQFLADKEMRYLLSTLQSNPHLVTIFDSCHSGDIVRAYHPEEESNGVMKRIAGAFPARAFDNFVFATDAEVATKDAGGNHTIEIPYKNHVHLAACLSSESSWEDSKGGVFTRYLIALLEATHGHLTYNDIARWAKISLKTYTEKNQTPTITVQGEDGKMKADNAWLNLFPQDAKFQPGSVNNNNGIGWIYSRGSLLGVEPGMKVIITANENKYPVTVKEVSPDSAELEVPLAVSNQLEFNKPYPAATEITTYAELKLFINPIDKDTETEEALQKFFTNSEKVSLVASDAAHFYVNIFNDLVYFSMPEHEFQPLAEQIKIGSGEDFENALREQLKAFVKWQHFYSLDNPAKDYDVSPIKVTVMPEGGRPMDITNGTHTFTALDARLKTGEQYQKMNLKVTNTSDEKLFLGVLILGSDLSITSSPLNSMVIELPPGASKTLFDHTKSKLAYATVDHYKEVYNWKEEWFYYKFIFNNFEDFTPALNTPDFQQAALEPPLTILNPNRGIQRSARGVVTDVEEVEKKWGTCISRIELTNGTYNIISGDLKELAEEYAASPEIAPFIKELYFEEEFNGKNIELQPKQNKNQTSDQARATDSFLVKFMNRIYKSARRRKFLRQKNSDGPVVIAEGDSWFLFPKPGVRDTLDYIMEKYRLYSLAEAGDEIRDYLKNNELIEAVKEHKPKYVLISGGGNDILGPEIQTILKTNVQNGAKATDFLEEVKFLEKLEFLSDGYKTFFEEIVKLEPNVTIYVHGYDYVRSNPDEKTIKKGWANKYMRAAGIEDHEKRKVIISYLVDTFNDLLKDLAAKYPNVRYVNQRGTVLEDEWMDEIHPNNIGYQKVANKFLAVME